jgi:hypothetical protein
MGHAVLRLKFVFASDESPSDAASGGLWGFGRVLRLEHPALHNQSFDMLRGELVSVSPVFLREQTREAEVRVRKHTCCVGRLHICTTFESKQPFVLGLCTIVGGLGGLGLRAATMLDICGATAVVLTSRNGSVAKGTQVNTEGRVEVRLLTSNVGEATEANKTCTHEVCPNVLHAAGLLHDKMIRFMTTDNFFTVCAPKALAASHLLASVTRSSLEALCHFSSVASTFGNVGQGAYAAANAYLDALASRRRHCGSVCSSLQLPAVRGAGMGAITFDKAQLDSMGAIHLDEFAVCLSVSLTAARSAAERTQAPLASAFLSGKVTKAVSAKEAGSGRVVEQRSAQTPALALARLPQTQRPTHIMASVLRSMREVSLSSVDEDSALMDAGVDSLAVIDVLNRLRMMSGAPLPAPLFFEEPTPRAVAAHIEENIDCNSIEDHNVPSSTVHSDKPCVVILIPGLDGSGTRGHS